MPTTINASNTTGGAVVTGDGSGVLELQSGGVTALTANGANVTVAGTLTATGGLTGTLGVANGGTGVTTLPANNVLIGNGTSAVAAVAPGTIGNVLTSNGTTWASTALPSNAVAYPQNSQSANYTLVIGDAGKQIFHPVADTTVRTYTIPANASVAFPIGTVVLFTVENGGTRVTVAITSDTLVFGDGTTGSLSVYPNNTLMAIKVTATKWMANYLYQTGNAAALASIAVATSTTPFIQTYSWNVSTGFGGKYANPATLPAGSAQSVAFSPDGNNIAVAHSTSPFITAYSWIGFGFGSKYTNPATLPTSTGRGVAFNPASTSIAVAHDTSPFVTAYPWSSSGLGTKYTNPATLPPSQGYATTFSPAGDAIAVAHAASPNVTAYPWNAGTGFGTKYADPGSLPPINGQSVAFSPA